MELPEDVLTLIYEFSRPVTRPDWRRCKLGEAYSIQVINGDILFWLYDLFHSSPKLCMILYDWTLFGRKHLKKRIQLGRLWQPDILMVHDTDWYESRFRAYWQN
jgi:hypothetical protein